jgi:protoporphyrinogen/coproporphyrinogen III oxidase
VARADADVLVVGAGLAGLAAAHRARQEGLGALVLEREDEPGGRARSEQWQGCTIELGASFVTPAYRRLRLLIEECGLDDRLTPMPNAFRTAIRREGRWHYIDYRWPEIEFLRYRGIGWREKASLLRLLPSQLRTALSARFFDLASAAAIDSAPLEDVIDPAANRYFASPVAEVFCSYPPEEVSLAFGVLGARYPTRRAWIMEGGLGSLTGELASRLQVRCGISVERVANEGPEVVAETSDGEMPRGRAAILATRASETLELWPRAPEETRRFLAGQTYSQGLGVFLRTREPVRRIDPRGRDLYMEILPGVDGTNALLSVVYLNQAAPDGGLILLDAFPRAAAANGDDTALAGQLESELTALHPEMRMEVTSRRILRWPVFVPAYPPGRARELATFRSGMGSGPIQLAGDYLYGPLMEAAVRAGQDAAERVARHLASPNGDANPFPSSRNPPRSQSR